VFTKLEAITRIIFHPHDDPLLEYQEDDGQAIEPLYYVPIIPMVRIRGLYCRLLFGDSKHIYIH
jgi:DNA topoisomerase-2